MRHVTWAVIARGHATAIVAVVTGVLLLAIGIVAFRSPDAPPMYRLDGKPVIDEEEFLREADRAFHRAARREEASLHPKAACWFTRAGDDEIQRILRCGPIVHYGGTQVRPWDELPFVASPVPGGVGLRLEGDPARGRGLPSGAVLSRPDGAEPPSRTEIEKLTIPPPPRVAPGELSLVTTVRERVDWRRAGVNLSGPGRLDVRVDEVATTSSALRLRDGPRRPAIGEEFVVARIDARNVSRAVVEVVAGPRRTAADSRRFGGSTVLVVSAPRDVDTRLTVTFRGITQEVSLRTGAVVATNPLLANTPRARPDRVIDRQEALVDLETRTAVSMASFTVTQVELTAHTDWLGAATPGMAWLVAELDGFTTPSVPGADSVRIDVGASFTFLLPDGRGVPAVELGRPQGSDLRVYFAVPEQTRSGVLRLEPTFVVEARGAVRPLTYARVELPLDLRGTSLSSR